MYHSSTQNTKWSGARILLACAMILQSVLQPGAAQDVTNGCDPSLVAMDRCNDLSFLPMAFNMTDAYGTTEADIRFMHQYIGEIYEYLARPPTCRNVQIPVGRCESSNATLIYPSIWQLQTLSMDDAAGTVSFVMSFSFRWWDPMAGTVSLIKKTALPSIMWNMAPDAATSLNAWGATIPANVLDDTLRYAYRYAVVDQHEETTMECEYSFRC